MIAKKIEEHTKAGSILSAAARLLSANNEVQAATGDIGIPISEIQYAVQALKFFEGREVALSEARAKFEPHCNPELGFSDSGPEWKAWVETTPYRLLCDQEESIQAIISSIERFIRLADCSTVEDIALKFQTNQFWIDELHKDAGDYAEESAALVRSIASIFKQPAKTNQLSHL